MDWTHYSNTLHDFLTYRGAQIKEANPLRIDSLVQTKKKLLCMFCIYLNNRTRFVILINNILRVQ